MLAPLTRTEGYRATCHHIPRSCASDPERSAGSVRRRHRDEQSRGGRPQTADSWQRCRACSPGKRDARHAADSACASAGLKQSRLFHRQRATTMMAQQRPRFTDMTLAECEALPARHHTERLSFTSHERIDIEPITYAVAKD